MTLAERYEKERQMETDQRIRKLRIRSVEHLMEYKLDPFGPEFDKAGKKLQQLRAEQHQAGLDRMKFHQETGRLEEAAKRAREDARRSAALDRVLESIDREAKERQERLEALRGEKEREHLEALVIQAEQERQEALREAQKQDQE